MPTTLSSRLRSSLIKRRMRLYKARNLFVRIARMKIQTNRAVIILIYFGSIEDKIMRLLDDLRTYYKRVEVELSPCRETYEILPGAHILIYSEDCRLPEVVEKFLKRKASIGEVRRTLRARSGL